MSRYLFILLYLISFNTSADWQIFSELGFWDFCNPDPTSVLQSKLDECVASRTYCAIFNLDPPECIESPPGSGGYINFSPVSFGEIMYKFDDPCPLPDQFLNQNTGQCDTPCPNNADQIRHEYPTDLATNPSWNDNPASSLSVDGCGYQLGGDGMEECYWKGNIVYCSAPYTPTGEPLAEGPESPQPDSPGDNDGIGKKSQDDIVTVTQEATRKENDSPAAGDTTTSDQTTEVTSVGTTTEIKTDLITSKGGQEITKTTTTTTRALSDGTTQTTTNTTYSDTGTTGITIVPSTGVRTTTSTPATSGTTTTTTSTGADGSQTTVQTTSGTGGDGQRGSGTGQQAEGGRGRGKRMNQQAPGHLRLTQL